MPTPEDIIGIVAAVTGVPAPAITGPRRTRMVAHARHLAVAAIYQQFPWMSLQELSDHVGRTDHGTSANSLIRHHELLKIDPRYACQAKHIRAQIDP